MPVKLAQAAVRTPAADVSSRGTRRDEGMTRRSIEVPGLRHGALPIPQASVVANLLVSGGINPIDPETGATPDDTDGQVAMAFANVRRVLAAAGGTPADHLDHRPGRLPDRIGPVAGRPC